MKQNSMLLWRRSFLFLIFFVTCIYFLRSRPPSFYNSTINQLSSKFLFQTSPRYLSSSLAAPSRLGNHIFEFAGLYGLSLHLNRTPVFWIEDETYRKMLERTREVVPGLVEKFRIVEGNIPAHVNWTKFHVKSRIYDNPQRLEGVSEEYLHLTGHFYQSWKYFPKLRDEIISYLKPQNEFRTLPKSDEETHVTCVHIRRTDFLSVGFYASDADFIRKAIQFIEDREKLKTHLKLMTVMFGDDKKFMMDVYPGSVASDSKVNDVKNTTVHFVSANSPADDLLYSNQHCDTVLISAPVSTFGWWIGYLSKGNRVFYLDVRTVDDSLYKSGRLKLDDYFLPKWTALKYSSDNKTVVEASS